MRIFIVGAPGACSKQIADAIQSEFAYDLVKVGQLFQAESQKNTDLGKKIKEKVGDYRFVDDKLVIDAVKSRISTGVENDSSYIIEGFPKNRVQSLSLQKIGIVPDKLVLLKVPDSVSLEKITESLINNGTLLQGEDLK